MKAKQLIAALILFVIGSADTKIQAQDMHMHDDHIMVMPNDINWGDAPASLPAGAQAAVIEGDPTKEGLFTLRLKVPANYKIMPHWHPVDEHITVLKGSAYMGMGDRYDEKSAMKMVNGAFAVMKTGTKHYFFTTEECIIQLHGLGPWGITYVNPMHDPRHKK